MQAYTGTWPDEKTLKIILYKESATPAKDLLHEVIHLIKQASGLSDSTFASWDRATEYAIDGAAEKLLAEYHASKSN